MNMLKKTQIVLLAYFFMSLPVYAQNYTETEQVILRSAQIIEEQFFSLEIGKKTAKSLRQGLLEKKYSSISSAQELEYMLTQELQKISGDNHIGVVYSPESVLRYTARLNAKESKQASEKNSDYQLDLLNESKLDNFGIKKVSLLKGKVGYLEMGYFDGFATESETAFEHVMNLLAGADAIILDFRRNGGGNSRVLPLFLSYFIGPNITHFATRYERWNNKTLPLSTLDNIKGAKHYDKPIYILTSGTTFSLAEHVTYHLRAFRNATVIGERTYGGGKAFDPIIVNDDFYLRIPRIEMVNTLTKSMYAEGKGITPDIAVSSDNAFDTAYYEALDYLKDKEQKPAEKERYQWIQRTLLLGKSTENMNLKMPFENAKHQFDEFLFENHGNEIWLSYKQLPSVKLTNLGNGYFYDDRSIQRQFLFDAKGDSLTLTVLRLGRPIRIINGN